MPAQNIEKAAQFKTTSEENQRISKKTDETYEKQRNRPPRSGAPRGALGPAAGGPKGPHPPLVSFVFIGVH